MDPELIVLRIVHIVLGVFWAGTTFFAASYLFPAVRATWPNGGRLLQQLVSRRFPTTIAIMGGITVLAGLRLYWKDAGGGTGWAHSPAGICFGLGGLAGLIALILGGARIRPAAERLAIAMAAADAATGDVERQTKLAEAQAAADRFGGAVRTASVLLGIAVLLMAVARYA